MTRQSLMSLEINIAIKKIFSIVKRIAKRTLLTFCHDCRTKQRMMMRQSMTMMKKKATTMTRQSLLGIIKSLNFAIKKIILQCIAIF